MPPDPRQNKVLIPIDSFDSNLLPPDKRDTRSPDYGLCIQEHLTKEFADFGINTRITAGPELIEFEWSSEGDETLADRAVKLLDNGRYKQGIRLFRTIRAIDPENEVMLLNLGKALINQDKLDDSIELLTKFVQLNPTSDFGFICLGMAHSKAGQIEHAIANLRKACELKPRNPFAQRNLGELLAKTGKANEAIPHFQKFTTLVPDVAVGWFGLGEAFAADGRASEADAAFRRVLELSPNSSISVAAQVALTKLAESALPKHGGHFDCPETVKFCLNALQSFTEMTNDQVKSIMFEIATRGMQGMDINNPEIRYSFKSIEGDFSGLKAVCYMYVAMQRLMPGVDAGIDLSKEFAKAKAMFNGQSLSSFETG
ncbi:MAG: tetratricopeptide repeat protein [Pirellula sp.]|jgi:tetratricopeptide (TPR) repeat protein|nr:tetratricopeptide repeat protein [Pirellula sp.]